MPSSKAGKFFRSLLPGFAYSALCKLYDRFNDRLFLLRSWGGPKQCPFCLKTWKQFQPDGGKPSPLFTQEKIVGGGPFSNSVCPWCGSFERERTIYLYLKEQTKILDSGITVMHMAPERRIQKWLSRSMQGKYVSVDLQSPLAEVHADICNLPFTDNFFDFVICNHVLEHIPDDRKAIREICRVLKVDGKAVLQVPIAAQRDDTEEDLSIGEAERLRRFGQHDHLRLYGRDYPDRLRSEGLAVECMDVRDKFSADVIERYGLLPDEILFIASKRG